MGKTGIALWGSVLAAILGVLCSCSTELPKEQRLEIRAAIDADYAHRLAAWPVPCEARFLSTRYGPTYAIISGGENAETIVLFHAMGTNALTWAPNVAALSERYRVVAIDTIGDQGRSIARRDYPENGAEYADWAADIVVSLEIEKADLAGCSMGGWIATCAAVYRPERVNKLVLVSPAAGIPTRTTWGSMLSSIVFDQSEKNIRAIAAKLLGSGAACRDWLDYFLLAVKDPEAIKLGIPGDLSDAKLAGIGSPVLLLIGDAEVVYENAADVFARATTLIKKISTATIPRAGHLGHYDNPGFVNDAMLDFLGAR